MSLLAIRTHDPWRRKLLLNAEWLPYGPFKNNVNTAATVIADINTWAEISIGKG